MTNKINGIDVSKYFKNHYDNSGRLYCVEYKGDPLELQNDIKRLQEENEGLKSLNDFNVQKIEVLQGENEKLKEYIKNLQVRKDRYYLQVLEFERQISDWVTFYMKISNIVSGNYETLDCQGLQDLRQIISEVAK